MSNIHQRTKTMPQPSTTATTTRTLISTTIALSLALLYALAAQAHFTPRLTPGLAANIDTMTPNAHRAFWFLGLDALSYEQCKWVFGVWDLVAAVLLCRRDTRTKGFAMAVVGFGCGAYGQWWAGEEIGQVGVCWGVAAVGLLTALGGRRR